MIVSPISGQLLVVTQADHARLASDLLSLMPRREVADHPDRGRLLRAVAEHDNGWWESDSAPRRDRSGRAPLDFREVDDRHREAVWRRGIDRFAAGEPDIAARIAGHALRLFAGRAEAGESWRRFVAEIAERRFELAAAAGIGLDALAADDAWLALADQLSLAACTGDPTFVDHEAWRVDAALCASGARLAVAPFPFAGATTLSLSCRLFDARPFGSDAELAGALALQRWLRLPVRVLPLD